MRSINQLMRDISEFLFGLATLFFVGDMIYSRFAPENPNSHFVFDLVLGIVIGLMISITTLIVTIHKNN